MKKNIIKIKSISELHKNFGFAPPKHPLITIIDTKNVNISSEYVGTKVVADLYMIALKDKNCGMEYGRNTYDFSEGVMVFSAPKQVSTVAKEMKPNEVEGWMLYFHSDLIRGTHLAEAMADFSFFSYEVFEALHLSEDEQRIVEDTIKNIKEEYSQRIDNLSQRVIASNLELLLNYCLRFYERQFNTRISQRKDILSKFEYELQNYFGKQEIKTMPSVKYFAEKLHLSPNYLSDLLKKETGQPAKDHINDYLVRIAKDKLLLSTESISEIAYGLGFEYPQHFSKLFKNHTGLSPAKYRSQN